MTGTTGAVLTRDRFRRPPARGNARRTGADEPPGSAPDSCARSSLRCRDGRVQLQLPLWIDESPKDSDARSTEAQAHQVPLGAHAASTASDEESHWTDEAVRRLHVAVLHHALRVLKSKGNTAEKCEILRWIWAPSVFCWVTRVRENAVTRVPIYRRQLPFMFETCCAFDGQRPEVLRDVLEEVLRPLLRELALESLIT